MYLLPISDHAQKSKRVNFLQEQWKGENEQRPFENESYKDTFVNIGRQSSNQGQITFLNSFKQKWWTKDKKIWFLVKTWQVSL